MRTLAINSKLINKGRFRLDGGFYLNIHSFLSLVSDYIQSMKYGSVIERVEPFHIESIPVVQPTVKISEEITSLVRRYMEYTYKAFVEEETAIKEVEQEIESWNKK